MRIAFEAPPGFTLTNSPQAILLEGPDGQRGEFAGGPLPGGDLEAYASALLSQTLGGAPSQVGPPARILANGLPAIVVPAEVRTEGGPVSLLAAVYDGGRGDAYHFVMVSAPNAPPSPALAELFGSFRILSPEQAATLRPRVLRTVRAGPGDTLEQFAALMATDHPLDSFMMLNARTADQPVRPGELLKIVTFAPG
jgi:predicted Zn-dependent protease